MTHTIKLTIAVDAVVATDGAIRIERNGDQKIAKVACDELLETTALSDIKIYKYKLQGRECVLTICGAIVDERIN